MTLKLELVLYHPPVDNEGDDLLWSTVIESEEIHRHSVTLREVGVNLTDKRRVLLIAIRRIEGSTSGLNASTFTFRCTRGTLTPSSQAETADEQAKASVDSELELNWISDIDAALGSNTGWQIGSLGHMEGVSINELIISWGHYNGPNSGPSLPLS